MALTKGKTHLTFPTTDMRNLPNGRKGKHHNIVRAILDDLVKLKSGQALKIPLAELPDTKVNIRSALNRATHKLGREVATSADDTFLYIWNS